jgi:hypothetical protein
MARARREGGDRMDAERWGFGEQCQKKIGNRVSQRSIARRDKPQGYSQPELPLCECR